MNMTKILDFPKLESPFLREMVDGAFVCTPKIAPGYEWCFEDSKVETTEKLDGTNVSILIEDSQVKAVYNRTERIPFINKGKGWLIKAILNSYERGYLDAFINNDGQYFGEVIGTKVNGNPYKLPYVSGDRDTQDHLWLPFDYYVREHLLYKSWGKYPKTFDNIRDWLVKPPEETGIFSLLLRKKGILARAEGVVLYNPATGQRAKLRGDMFAEYSGARHKEQVET